MIAQSPSISVDLDLTNPGQFFACCGLFELASRIDPDAEGWFDAGRFHVAARCQLSQILASVTGSKISNTMSLPDLERLKELSGMSKKARESVPGKEEEKKSLESLRRELPIVLVGDIPYCIDWFCDGYAGGSRFKTWAGQQSVLDIAQSMHEGIKKAEIDSAEKLWQPIRGVGLPFNFDSDLGGQGSALDIGFSFDPLAASEATRIDGTCKPALELLCFVGLQRFRPLEIAGKNRFLYVAWTSPLDPTVAAPAVSNSMPATGTVFEFSLLYRTKYLKSFLPAQPLRGERDE